MQKFQYPNYLHLLWLLIPLVGLLVWYIRWRKTTMNSYFSPAIQPYIFQNLSRTLPTIKWVLLLLAFIFLIIGIANPQIGVKEEKIKGKGIDVMILLDVSNSMLAEDIQPNRLERSKLFISKLIDHLGHDRVGLVIFAGNSYLQVPLTIDYSAIKLNLPLIDPSSIPSQGTNIGEAVELAGASLGLTDSKHKAIVILTDGEDHDQNADAAIKEAKQNGIKVFAIGVGTEKGAPIPMNGDYKRDESGNVITTAFNRKMLESLASIGNGSFYELGQQSDIVEEVSAGLKSIEGKDFEDFDFSNYNSYFYWFLLCALVLIVVEFILPNIQMNSFFKKIAPILILSCSISILTAQPKNEIEKKENSKSLIRRGNVQYQGKKYQEAELNYRKSLAENPKNNATASYNLGNALYEQKKYKEAVESLSKSKAGFQDKSSLAKNYHNLGNAYFKENNLDSAIRYYENALKLQPSDLDTKYNLAMAKKQKKNQGGGGSNNQQQKNQQQQQQKESDQGKPSDQKKDGDSKDPADEKQEKPTPGQMSKEDAQKLLEALKNQEQNTQRKVDQQKQKPEQKKHEKDY